MLHDSFVYDFATELQHLIAHARLAAPGTRGAASLGATSTAKQSTARQCDGSCVGAPRLQKCLPLGAESTAAPKAVNWWTSTSDATLLEWLEFAASPTVAATLRPHSTPAACDACGATDSELCESTQRPCAAAAAGFPFPLFLWVRHCRNFRGLLEAAWDAECVRYRADSRPATNRELWQRAQTRFIVDALIIVRNMFISTALDVLGVVPLTRGVADDWAARGAAESSIALAMLHGWRQETRLRVCARRMMEQVLTQVAGVVVSLPHAPLSSAMDTTLDELLRGADVRKESLARSVVAAIELFWLHCLCEVLTGRCWSVAASRAGTSDGAAPQHSDAEEVSGYFTLFDGGASKVELYQELAGGSHLVSQRSAACSPFRLHQTPPTDAYEVPVVTLASMPPAYFLSAEQHGALLRYTSTAVLHGGTDIAVPEFLTPRAGTCLNTLLLRLLAALSVTDPACAAPLWLRVSCLARRAVARLGIEAMGRRPEQQEGRAEADDDGEGAEHAVAREIIELWPALIHGAKNAAQAFLAQAGSSSLQEGVPLCASALVWSACRASARHVGHAPPPLGCFSARGDAADAGDNVTQLALRAIVAATKAQRGGPWPASDAQALPLLLTATHPGSFHRSQLQMLRGELGLPQGPATPRAIPSWEAAGVVKGPVQPERRIRLLSSALDYRLDAHGVAADIVALLVDAECTVPLSTLQRLAALGRDVLFPVSNIAAWRTGFSSCGSESVVPLSTVAEDALLSLPHRTPQRNGADATRTELLLCIHATFLSCASPAFACAFGWYWVQKLVRSITETPADSDQCMGALEHLAGALLECGQLDVFGPGAGALPTSSERSSADGSSCSTTDLLGSQPHVTARSTNSSFAFPTPPRSDEQRAPGGGTAKTTTPTAAPSSSLQLLEGPDPLSAKQKTRKSLPQRLSLALVSLTRTRSKRRSREGNDKGVSACDVESQASVLVTTESPLGILTSIESVPPKLRTAVHVPWTAATLPLVAKLIPSITRPNAVASVESAGGDLPDQRLSLGSRCHQLLEFLVAECRNAGLSELLSHDVRAPVGSLEHIVAQLAYLFQCFAKRSKRDIPQREARLARGLHRRNVPPSGKRRYGDALRGANDHVELAIPAPTPPRLLLQAAGLLLLLLCSEHAADQGIEMLLHLLQEGVRQWPLGTSTENSASPKGEAPGLVMKLSAEAVCASGESHWGTSATDVLAAPKGGESEEQCDRLAGEGAVVALIALSIASTSGPPSGAASRGSRTSHPGPQSLSLPALVRIGGGWANDEPSIMELAWELIAEELGRTTSPHSCLRILPSGAASVRICGIRSNSARSSHLLKRDAGNYRSLHDAFTPLHGGAAFTLLFEPVTSNVIQAHLAAFLELTLRSPQRTPQPLRSQDGGDCRRACHWLGAVHALCAGRRWLADMPLSLLGWRDVNGTGSLDRRARTQPPLQRVSATRDSLVNFPASSRCLAYSVALPSFAASIAESSAVAEVGDPSGSGAALPAQLAPVGLVATLTLLLQTSLVELAVSAGEGKALERGPCVSCDGVRVQSTAVIPLAGASALRGSGAGAILRTLGELYLKMRASGRHVTSAGACSTNAPAAAVPEPQWGWIDLSPAVLLPFHVAPEKSPGQRVRGSCTVFTLRGVEIGEEIATSPLLDSVEALAVLLLGHQTVSLREVALSLLELVEAIRGLRNSRSPAGIPTGLTPRGPLEGNRPASAPQVGASVAELLRSEVGSRIAAQSVSFAQHELGMVRYAALGSSDGGASYHAPASDSVPSGSVAPSGLRQTPLGSLIGSESLAFALPPFVWALFISPDIIHYSHRRSAALLRSVSAMASEAVLAPATVADDAASPRGAPSAIGRHSLVETQLGWYSPSRADPQLERHDSMNDVSLGSRSSGGGAGGFFPDPVPPTAMSARQPQPQEPRASSDTWLSLLAFACAMVFLDPDGHRSGNSISSGALASRPGHQKGGVSLYSTTSPVTPTTLVSDPVGSARQQHADPLAAEGVGSADVSRAAPPALCNRFQLAGKVYSLLVYAAGLDPHLPVANGVSVVSGELAIAARCILRRLLRLPKEWDSGRPQRIPHEIARPPLRLYWGIAYNDFTLANWDAVTRTCTDGLLPHSASVPLTELVRRCLVRLPLVFLQSQRLLIDPPLYGKASALPFANLVRTLAMQLEDCLTLVIGPHNGCVSVCHVATRVARHDPSSAMMGQGSASAGGRGETTLAGGDVGPFDGAGAAAAGTAGLFQGPSPHSSSCTGGLATMGQRHGEEVRALKDVLGFPLSHGAAFLLRQDACEIIGLLFDARVQQLEPTLRLRWLNRSFHFLFEQLCLMLTGRRRNWHSGAEVRARQKRPQCFDTVVALVDSNVNVSAEVERLMRSTLRGFAALLSIPGGARGERDGLNTAAAAEPRRSRPAKPAAPTITQANSTAELHGHLCELVRTHCRILLSDVMWEALRVEPPHLPSPAEFPGSPECSAAPRAETRVALPKRHHFVIETVAATALLGDFSHFLEALIAFEPRFYSDTLLLLTKAPVGSLLHHLITRVSANTAYTLSAVHRKYDPLQGTSLWSRAPTTAEPASGSVVTGNAPLKAIPVASAAAGVPVAASEFGGTVDQSWSYGTHGRAPMRNVLLLHALLTVEMHHVAPLLEQCAEVERISTARGDDVVESLPPSYVFFKTQQQVHHHGAAPACPSHGRAPRAGGHGFEGEEAVLASLRQMLAIVRGKQTPAEAVLHGNLLDPHCFTSTEAEEWITALKMLATAPEARDVAPHSVGQRAAELKKVIMFCPQTILQDLFDDLTTLLDAALATGHREAHSSETRHVEGFCPVTPPLSIPVESPTATTCGETGKSSCSSVPSSSLNSAPGEEICKEKQRDGRPREPLSATRKSGGGGAAYLLACLRLWVRVLTELNLTAPRLAALVRMTRAGESRVGWVNAPNRTERAAAFTRGQPATTIEQSKASTAAELSAMGELKRLWCLFLVDTHRESGCSSQEASFRKAKVAHLIVVEGICPRVPRVDGSALGEIANRKVLCRYLDAVARFEVRCATDSLVSSASCASDGSRGRASGPRPRKARPTTIRNMHYYILMYTTIQLYLLRDIFRAPQEVAVTSPLSLSRSGGTSGKASLPSQSAAPELSDESEAQRWWSTLPSWRRASIRCEGLHRLNVARRGEGWKLAAPESGAEGFSSAAVPIVMWYRTSPHSPGFLPWAWMAQHSAWSEAVSEWCACAPGDLGFDGTAIGQLMKESSKEIVSGWLRPASAVLFYHLWARERVDGASVWEAMGADIASMRSFDGLFDAESAVTSGVAFTESPASSGVFERAPSSRSSMRSSGTVAPAAGRHEPLQRSGGRPAVASTVTDTESDNTLAGTHSTLHDGRVVGGLAPRDATLSGTDDSDCTVVVHCDAAQPHLLDLIQQLSTEGSEEDEGHISDTTTPPPDGFHMTVLRQTHRRVRCTTSSTAVSPSSMAGRVEEEDGDGVDEEEERHAASASSSFETSVSRLVIHPLSLMLVTLGLAASQVACNPLLVECLDIVECAFFQLSRREHSDVAVPGSGAVEARDPATECRRWIGYAYRQIGLWRRRLGLTAEALSLPNRDTGKPARSKELGLLLASQYASNRKEMRSLLHSRPPQPTDERERDVRPVSIADILGTLVHAYGQQVHLLRSWLEEALAWSSSYAMHGAAAELLGVTPDMKGASPSRSLDPKGWLRHRAAAPPGGGGSTPYGKQVGKSKPRTWCSPLPSNCHVFLGTLSIVVMSAIVQGLTRVAREPCLPGSPRARAGRFTAAAAQLMLLRIRHEMLWILLDAQAHRLLLKGCDPAPAAEVPGDSEADGDATQPLRAVSARAVQTVAQAALSMLGMVLLETVAMEHAIAVNGAAGGCVKRSESVRPAPFDSNSMMSADDLPIFFWSAFGELVSSGPLRLPPSQRAPAMLPLMSWGAACGLLEVFHRSGSMAYLQCLRLPLSAERWNHPESVYLSSLGAARAAAVLAAASLSANGIEPHACGSSLEEILSYLHAYSCDDREGAPFLAFTVALLLLPVQIPEDERGELQAPAAVDGRPHNPGTQLDFNSYLRFFRSAILCRGAECCARTGEAKSGAKYGRLGSSSSATAPIPLGDGSERLLLGAEGVEHHMDHSLQLLLSVACGLFSIADPADLFQCVMRADPYGRCEGDAEDPPEVRGALTVWERWDAPRDAPPHQGPRSAAATGTPGHGEPDEITGTNVALFQRCFVTYVLRPLLLVLEAEATPLTVSCVILGFFLAVVRSWCRAAGAEAAAAPNPTHRPRPSGAADMFRALRSGILRGVQLVKRRVGLSPRAPEEASFRPSGCDRAEFERSRKACATPDCGLKSAPQNAAFAWGMEAPVAPEAGHLAATLEQAVAETDRRCQAWLYQDGSTSAQAAEAVAVEPCLFGALVDPSQRLGARLVCSILQLRRCSPVASSESSGAVAPVPPLDVPALGKSSVFAATETAEDSPFHPCISTLGSLRDDTESPPCELDDGTPSELRRAAMYSAPLSEQEEESLAAGNLAGPPSHSAVFDAVHEPPSLPHHSQVPALFGLNEIQPFRFGSYVYVLSAEEPTSMSPPSASGLLPPAGSYRIALDQEWYNVSQWRSE